MKKQHFASGDPGLMACLFSPIPLLCSSLTGTSSYKSAVVFVVECALLVSFMLLIWLLMTWILIKPKLQWNQLNKSEQKALEQRASEPLWKRFVTFSVFFLLVSAPTMTFLYLLASALSVVKLSLLAFLAGTFVSYLLASVAAIIWVAMVDRRLRATRTPTS